jgi:hypothetical protein
MSLKVPDIKRLIVPVLAYGSTAQLAYYDRTGLNSTPYLLSFHRIYSRTGTHFTSYLLSSATLVPTTTWYSLHLDAIYAAGILINIIGLVASYLMQYTLPSSSSTLYASCLHAIDAASILIDIILVTSYCKTSHRWCPSESCVNIMKLIDLRTVSYSRSSMPPASSSASLDTSRLT